MHRSPRLRFSFLLLSLGLLLAAMRCSRQESPPDVVVLVLDAFRAQSMTIYDARMDTTPRLAALAREGAVFEYAVSNGLWTRASVPSILTGLTVSSHAQVRGGVDAEQFDVLPEAAVTAAERFGSAGYSTRLVSPMAWYERAFGFQQGFESVTSWRAIRQERGDEGDGSEQAYGLTIREYDRTSLEMLLDEVAEETADVPLFTHIHLLAAHAPVNLPPEALGTFVSADEYDRYMEQSGPYFFGDAPDGEAARQRLQEDPAYRDFCQRLYLEGMRYADDAAATFIERYRELRPNTIFVITADHGEMLEEEWGERTHGDTVTPYDELVRVPLVFHGPGLVPAGRHESPAMLADILPTVLELTGVEAQGESFDGRSLAELLRGEENAADWQDRVVFSEGGEDGFTLALANASHKYVRLMPGGNLWQLGRAPNGEMLRPRGRPDAPNSIDSEPSVAAGFRQAADALLLGRSGFHLVAVGGGSPQRISGRVVMREAVTRATLARHSSRNLVDWTLLRPSLDEQILEPGASLELVSPAAPQARGATDDARSLLVAVTAAIEVRRPPPNSVLKVTRDNIGRLGRSTEWVNLPEGVDATVVRDLAAPRARESTITVENGGRKPLTIARAAVGFSPDGPGTYAHEGDAVRFDYPIARGLMDLHWSVAGDAAALSVEGIEGTRLFVWRGEEGFVETPSDARGELVTPVAPRAAVMEHLRDAGAGVYLYQLSPFSGEGSGSMAPVDEEALERLKSLGYF